MHNLIIGITASGKSTLAKKIASDLHERKYPVLVLDSVLDAAWKCTFITDNQDDFLYITENSEKCFLFIDESADYVHHYNKVMHKLATRYRHKGHTCFFICQRATMISPNIRTNCTKLFLFKSVFTDCKLLSDDFITDRVFESTEFSKGEFLYINLDKNITEKRRVF